MRTFERRRRGARLEREKVGNDESERGLRDGEKKRRRACCRGPLPRRPIEKADKRGPAETVPGAKGMDARRAGRGECF